MSSHWASGYVADLTYSHGYYHELAPPFMRFFLLMSGYGNLGQGGAYDYCELGFGQGVSCNLHAAANARGRFCGTDFNAEHALFAQGLAADSGLQADWRGLSFEQMLEADLPSFDVIALHGVWSWIDAPARHAVVEFIRRRLRLGGVVYLSCNVMPGWSAEKPLRDLLWLHAETAGAAGGSTRGKVSQALAFADRLRKGKAAFFQNGSAASQMLDDMLRDDVHVLAHEYFNRSWHLTYFAELARTLDAAGLNFACSVHRSDVTGEVFHRTRELDLGELPVPLRQTANDFVLNRRFRRDLFVRGGRRLARSERQERIEQVQLLLQGQPGGITPTLQTPYGTVTLDAGLTRRIADVMEAAPGPVRIGELIEKADLGSMPRELVFEVLAALVAHGQLSAVFDDDLACRDASRAQAMNRVIAERARHDDDVRYLASPVTGLAIEASRDERLFLLAWEQGARTTGELCRLGLAAPAEGGAEGRARAARFLETVVPRWRRLGIIEEVA
ncbi:class I SAM-dependent methyltransferase [Ramlibacter sp. AW1]|uniref:Class I SAM-dependent methyltransferase n=1 Tax=Ramlibacter aurantiacus TaxID=2801330 RepID=A0A936ZIY4_9BURK|nr:class I SAM-dependent methyltransferase [Ramlibacter aurantiacus]MBL0421063.1 class I SAM-dependent methyltransferase [Ramlibacter aurantiacus]